MPQRLKLLTQWLETVVDGGDFEIATCFCEDASFRRYFRVTKSTAKSWWLCRQSDCHGRATR